MIKAFLGTNSVVLKEVEENRGKDFISASSFVELEVDDRIGKKIYFISEEVNLSKEQKELLIGENDYLYGAIEMTIGEDGVLNIEDDVMFISTELMGGHEVPVLLFKTNIFNENSEDALYRKKEVFKDFFRVIRSDDGQHLVFDNSVLPLIKEILETEDNVLYGHNQNEISLVVYDYFRVEGKLSLGYCESVSLDNLQVVDFYSEKELFDLPSVSLEANLTMEEDDEEDSLLDAYLDSLPEDEMRKFILKSMNDIEKK